MKLDNIVIFENVFKCVLSDSKCEYKKIVIENISDKYQASKYTEKQVFHENFNDFKSALASYIEDFNCVNIFDDLYQYSYRETKKGKVLSNKAKHGLCLECKTNQNREKNYIIKPGEIIPPLVDMGIFTSEGKIVSKMYDKFKQINRFIELIDDVISKQNLNHLNIIDFGCGKSYLTFILYYYLVEIKHIDVNIVGLDLKEDVIKKCNEAAKKYNYKNLHFELGNIDGYKANFEVDMVITLHACDTATDFALYNAICWNAKYIFSVPCCQHEVNKQFKSDSFNIMNRYGIAKERVSALFTDMIRCNLLQYSNYTVDMVEFVDLSHTPKNVLIRAIKSNRDNKQNEKFVLEVEKLQKEYNFQQMLYKLLKK